MTVRELERIATVKASAAESLRELGVQLAAARNQSPGGGMQALFARVGADAALVDEWQQVLDVAARCQERNHENAVLLRARHAQVRAALFQLRGPSDPAIYGRRGEAGAGLPSRHFGAV